MNPADGTDRSFALVRDDEDAGALVGAVFAIGNFDGVHRGHQAVIATARRRAQALGRPAAALTFEPHPRSYFRRHDPMFRLTDEHNKVRLLAASGLQGCVVMTFDAKLAGLSAQEFVASKLLGQLAASGVTIGFDFHFGKDRQGSPAFLKSEGERLGFSVDVVPPLEDEGRPVSSSTVRAALEAGRVVEAAELLGYPWFVTGTVIHGEKRGRALGFPTANLRLDPACKLQHGIYAVRVGCEGKSLDAVASFGQRPTFDNGAALLEVYVFDFDGDLYGKTIDVAFIGWIRPEMRFERIDDLVARMRDDCVRAREALARPGRPFPPLQPGGGRI